MAMVRVRFTGKNHYHDGESLEQGDVVEISEREFERWSYQFVSLEDEDSSDEDGSESSESVRESAESVSDEEAYESVTEEKESADEAESDSENDGDEIPDLLDLNVPEIEEEIEAGHFDDRLDQVEIEESLGDDRFGVKDAVESRRDSLEEE